MVNVKNRKIINELSAKNMKANKTRNKIAIAAIILTTVLFTSLFTILITVQHSSEEQSFRQVGGKAHGTFKYVTEDIIDELSGDELIKTDLKRLVISSPTEAPFNKQHTEISYMDKACVDDYFCTPEHGRLPKEGTMEAICDSKVLDMLGIEPKEGAEITVTYNIGYEGMENCIHVTDTFTLVGWWTHDEAINCCHIIVPLSYANEKFAEYKPIDNDDTVGTWAYSVFFKSAKNIEKNMKQVLENHGYQNEDAGKDNYVDTGINWAYSEAQLDARTDVTTILEAAVMIVVFIVTGYLIIYNIFQISVVNDIRFYGLLKTIGTTRRQLKKIIYRQAFRLSVIGIPLGLIIGYLCGNIIVPFVMNSMDGNGKAYMTFNPLIFVGATVFSIITVFISLTKPGKIAGKVSPVEAVKYTDVTNIKKKKSKVKGRQSVYHMAFANLGRNKKKTILVVMSFSLSVVILHVVVTFVKGFDADKFLENLVISDYEIASASYFQNNWGYGEDDDTLSEELISKINSYAGVTAGGRIYGYTDDVKTLVTEEWYRNNYNNTFLTEEEINQTVEILKEGDMIADMPGIYGMDEYPLNKLGVINGDISKLKDKDKKYILAVYMTDDYGNVIENSNFAKIGDKVELTYQTWEIFNTKTNKIISKKEAYNGSIPDSDMDYRIKDTWKETYIVAAEVTVPHAMSYRYYGRAEFVMDTDTFLKDTKTDKTMVYMFDTTDEDNEDIGNFVKNYTEEIDTSLDYDSRAKYMDAFNELIQMFVIIGGGLCIIVGIIGVLNFIYAIVTSMMTRKREFAMLRSIGMTVKQLKHMLMTEGVWYSVLAIISSFIICILISLFIGKVIGSIFWFFTYHFTLIPFMIITPIFLIMGIVVPYVVFGYAKQDSIVDELRNAD